MTTQPPFDGTVPAEPVRGEPPVLSHDPASIAGRDTSVRVLGADVAAGMTGRVTAIPASTPAAAGAGLSDAVAAPGPDVTGNGATGESSIGHGGTGDGGVGIDQGPIGPVPGLVPGLTAPVLPDAPKVRKRRRRGWFTAAGVLAVVGVGCCAFAVVTDSGTPRSTGVAPTSQLVTPVLSARRAPELLARPVAARAVKAAVDPVIAKFPATSCVLVTDGTTQLASSGADTPLAPASNTKLLTATAALDVLGADTKLVTKVESATPPKGGTVTGDLFLVGGGDPLLSTATSAALTAHGKEPTSSMEALADQVVASGVRTVTGSVVGDGSRYDDVRTAPKWPQRYITDGTASNLGALMVNDARTIDPIKPGGTSGPAPDPALHAATVNVLAMPGMPVIYYGEEFGKRGQRDRYVGNEPYDHDEFIREPMSWYKALTFTGDKTKSWDIDFAKSNAANAALNLGAGVCAAANPDYRFIKFMADNDLASWAAQKDDVNSLFSY